MQGESQLVFACGHMALTMLLLSMTKKKKTNEELELQTHITVRFALSEGL